MDVPEWEAHRGRLAWTNPHFQQLVVRGMYWAAGREVKDPPAEK